MSVCWKEGTPPVWRVVPAFWIHRCHPIQLPSLLLSLMSPSQCLLTTLKTILHWESTAPTSTAADYQCDYSLLGFQLHPFSWLKGPGRPKASRALVCAWLQLCLSSGKWFRPCTTHGCQTLTSQAVGRERHSPCLSGTVLNNLIWPTM